MVDIDRSARAITQATNTIAQDPAEKKLDVKIFVVNQARSIEFLKTAITAASSLFEKCQITLKARISSITIAEEASIDEKTRNQVAVQYSQYKPAVFVIPATAEQDVAFSYLPSLNRGVAATSWVTDRVSDRCFVWIMVHELGHIMFDHPKHSAGSNNIMSVACKQTNWGSRRIAPDWTDQQCHDLRQSDAVNAIRTRN